MGTTPIRPLVDRVLDGQLDETLRRYVADGLSPSRMSLRLASEFQVEVSGPTLKKWVAALPPGQASTAQTTQTAQSTQTAQTNEVTISGSRAAVSS